MPNDREIILLAGRPGSGKSTLARSIQEQIRAEGAFSSEHLSIGDRLRAIGGGVIQSVFSADILEHSKTLSKSERLPAHTVRAVVQEYLETRSDQTTHVFVDGYPRYEDEVDPFMRVADLSSYRVSGLVHLGLSNDDAVERILSRGTRENERSVDEEFARWRLGQHDTHYNLTRAALERHGVPVFNINAALEPRVVASSVAEVLGVNSVAPRTTR